MTRSLLAIASLVAAMLTIPWAPQVAVADTGCPTASGSYSGGAGTAGSPWEISGAGDLQRLRDDSITGWDDSFILTGDIDMGGCTWTTTIGDGTTAFSGLLDGGGHTISGLNVAVAETTTNAYAGLVGRLSSPGAVTRLGFDGSVNASVTTGSTKFSYAGGLVGYAQVGSTVSYSYATGPVDAYISLGSAFSSAFAYAGGLVGRLDGSITDSYATGAVTAAAGTGDKFLYAGGLIGYSTSSVARSYSTGAASATAAPSVSLAGGFVGQTNGGTLSDSLWDVTASGLANGAGPATPAGVVGKTTTQMKQFSTYDDSSWPITNGWVAFNAPTTVWGICSGSGRAFLLWQYAANPCTTAPGAPTIVSITPDQTTASLAFAADDSGGSTILAIQFALDDTTAIDGSSTNASPLTLTGLTSGTAYTVYLRAVNARGPSPWSAPSSFTTQTPTPPPPTPPTAPLYVEATAGNASLSATWSAPASTGSFPVTNYQATASPGGKSCLATVTSCTIAGLTNGVTYSVSVKALSGAGWSPGSESSNAVTPQRNVLPTLTIAGSRGEDRRLVRIVGSSTGLVGEQVSLWIAFNGQEARPGVKTALIGPEGGFTWSRRTSREMRVFAQVGSTRSNTITIPER